ncbi:MAG: SurA N-terminal domain-containing protein, partial [Prevotellaceae bacterium]|nr:SurA N-terminal domain-containing protein [Prevotellaceae bacterium]
MATLGRIRSHGIFLLIVIGVSMVIFIITGFSNDFSNLFHPNRNSVGKIDGEKIDYQAFFAEKEQAEDFYKMIGQDIQNDEASDQILQQTWDQLVMRKLIEKDAAAIGMIVSPQELKDLTIGNNISPAIAQQQMFINQETGRFDPSLVVALIQQLDNADVVKNAPSEQLKLYRNYWKFLETNVKYSRLFEKYNTLLSKSLVVNSLEAKYAYEANKASVDVIYAMKPYFAVADSLVKVSDAEVKTLYNKRKEQYKQEPSVDFNYVVFAVKPSPEDFTAVEDSINKAKEKFAVAEDIIDVVASYSDVPYNDVFLSKNDISEDLKEFAFSGAKGTVFGPILTNDTYKLARIMENTVASDSVKLSIIAVAGQTEEATIQKRDSLLNVLKSGADFAQTAAQFSMDKQTAARGGEFGWLRETQVEQIFGKKELSEPLFRAAVNTPFVIDDMQGIIFCITEKTKPVSKVKLAVIECEVTPTSATQIKIFQDAKQFAAACKTADLMPAIAAEKGYTLVPATNINHNTPRLGNIKGSRTVIRWAFDNKVNVVSDVQECGTEFIVAGVTKRNNDKYVALADVKPALEAELRRDKKFEQVKAEFNGKTIEQLAAENLTVDTVKNLTFGSYSAGRLGNVPT